VRERRERKAVPKSRGRNGRLRALKAKSELEEKRNGELSGSCRVRKQLNASRPMRRRGRDAVYFSRRRVDKPVEFLP